MEKQAYLIGFINKQTNQLERVQTAGHFPVTGDLNYHQVELHCAYEWNFSDGHKKLLKDLQDPYWTRLPNNPDK